jgi:hypothetical protein
MPMLTLAQDDGILGTRAARLRALLPWRDFD